MIVSVLTMVLLRWVKVVKVLFLCGVDDSEDFFVGVCVFWCVAKGAVGHGAVTD